MWVDRNELWTNYMYFQYNFLYETRHAAMVQETVARQHSHSSTHTYSTQHTGTPTYLGDKHYLFGALLGSLLHCQQFLLSFVR